MSLPVSALFAALVSAVQKLGVFEQVVQHEPKNAPVTLPAVAIWWNDPLKAEARASGMGGTASVVTGFRARVYQCSMIAEPQDAIDVNLLANTELLIEAITAAFTLGGQARNVDLLGMYGGQLEATPGFILHESTLFRVAEVEIPVIINDAWPVAP